MLALKYSISVFFFFLSTLFIYFFISFFIMLCEMGLVFEQCDEEASMAVDVEKAGGTRLQRTPPPRSL